MTELKLHDRELVALIAPIARLINVSNSDHVMGPKPNGSLRRREEYIGGGAAQWPMMEEWGLGAGSIGGIVNCSGGAVLAKVTLEWRNGWATEKMANEVRVVGRNWLQWGEKVDKVVKAEIKVVVGLRRLSVVRWWPSVVWWVYCDGRR
ncbi:unnamed protein product [Sphenostylis stenocarpa]|uniref:Uncharacterized protein n=1 Tax=Sphenostylis stenocarpa TaxID=92480 RepID=A0AA86W0T2_9FABA|nr:unnamed protein product [Sphenostylis stenocarpa]